MEKKFKYDVERTLWRAGFVVEEVEDGLQVFLNTRPIETMEVTLALMDEGFDKALLVPEMFETIDGAVLVRTWVVEEVLDSQTNREDDLS